MYGFTMRSYKAGVSRTTWNCLLELCAKKKKGIVKDGWVGMKWNDLANVYIGGRINDIDLYVWPILGMSQPTQHPHILGG